MGIKYLIVVLTFVYLLIGSLFFIETASSKPHLCPVEELHDCKKQPFITLEEIPTAMYLVLFWPFVLARFVLVHAA